MLIKKFRLRNIHFFIIWGILFLSSHCMDAQDNQISKYTIQLALDTTHQTITATQTIDYYNNSGVELDKIYIHLWANAYQSNDTKLVEQSLMLGQSELYFLSNSQRGGYEKLELQVEGLQVESYYDDDTQEILVIELNESLPAQARLSIEIDFKIKIPKLISRFGYEENYYQMTHWYPRVAKCELGLWHAMPYLALGEYYHDFADYEVHIEIPESHQIIATGSRYQKDSKIYSFRADRVTDFAWFVSDAFSFETEQIKLEEESIQLTIAKHGDKHAWNESMTYLKRSINFLSDEIGHYPYPEAKLVLSPYGEGSGMEYPMISVISESHDPETVDHLVVHEMAHNWFYAAIATNERRHPWMDEGLSTFYDHKYHKQYYGRNPYQNALWQFLDTESPLSLLESSVIAQYNLAKLEGSDMHSENYSGLNYGISIYERMAMAYAFLQEYLGEAKFKEAISAYSEKYKFKHPGPEDLQSVFETVCSEDLSWFFEGFLAEAESADYEISSARNGKLTIQNKAQVPIPFAIERKLINGDTIIDWESGFLGSKVFDIHSDSLQDVKLPIRLNKLDVNPWNNQNRAIRFKFLAGLDNPENRMIFGTPYMAFNEHDGLYAGFAAYNSSFPFKRFRWFLAPGFSITGTENNVVGLGSIQYDLVRDRGNARKLIGGLNFKRFSYFSNETYSLDYNRLKLFLRLYFKTHPKSRTTKYLEFNTQAISEESAIFNEEDIFFDQNMRTGQQLIYNYSLEDPIANVAWKTILEFQVYPKQESQNSSYLKLTSNYQYKYQFAKSRFLKFNFFGSYFLLNSERHSSSFFSQLNRGSISLIDQGFTDQFYDQYYLGRNLQSGILSRQVGVEGGGFKNALGSAYRLGLSNHYAFAVNFMIDSPLFLKPYFDIGYYGTKTASEAEFKSKSLWSIGLALEFVDGAVGLYLPLFNSSEISDIYQTQSFLSRISFKLNINRLDLWKAAEDLNF